MRRRVYNEHSVLTQERRTPRFNEVEKDLLDMACNNNHRDNLTYKQNDEHEIITVEHCQIIAAIIKVNSKHSLYF